MNKKPYESNEHLVRSGARIRESVRCLPRGHFQQIRQMFDRSTQPSNNSKSDSTNIVLSSIENQRRQLAMAAAVNYAESYESSPTNRMINIQSDVSNFSRTSAVHAKPVLVKTTYQIPLNDEDNHELFQSSKRLHSSTSLSSTGYDSNSSSSIVSKRNSLMINSSSSEDKHQLKPWMLYESNNHPPITIENSYSSDDISDSPPLVSRSYIKFNHSPAGTLERRPISVVRHTAIRPLSIADSQSVSSAKYTVQTTSFTNRVLNDQKISSTDFRKKYHELSNQPRSTAFSPIVIQKSIETREQSPLPVVENPLFKPPQKPPRTFDQKAPSSASSSSSSSSSSSHSPIFDLGARSVSCMDLTAGVSNALFSSGLLPLQIEENIIKENIYEELKPPQSTIESNTSRLKSKMKSSMKKGVSEPNLAKGKFFSARALFDRFKRILPLSLSKQSLNDSNVITIESEDSESLSSENNDQLRLSRLDHVSRVKNVYDTLTSANHHPSTPSNPRQLQTFYDYVVHLLPEQDLGYFANGTGCLSSSNLQHPISSSNSIRFKYPFDANEESTLKYFCFPDQHDSNNNNYHPYSNFSSYALSKTSKPEYFRFTLTDMSGARQHGYCSRFLHKGILNALCLISPCDMIDLYQKILSTATELYLSYKDEDARKFLKEIYPHRLPNRGDTIHIQTSTVGLYTLKCEYDRRKQLIDVSTLLRLSTDTIIKIFSSILYEQKIIFIADELGPLTRLINTFITLLYPFTWPHTYIPILPALMLDVIQAPTPYIIGLLRSCEIYLSDHDDISSQDTSDIVIVDIDHDRIRSINDYEFNRVASTDDHFSYQILPKMFKIELKQEISFLRKNQTNLSIDECQQRLQTIFMSIFVQSCYNYRDYLGSQTFNIEHFIQSKHRTIELFLEWFTRTQLFQLFIRQQSAVTFDLACEKYRRTLKNRTFAQRPTVKSVKRKATFRAAIQRL